MNYCKHENRLHENNSNGQGGRCNVFMSVKQLHMRAESPILNSVGRRPTKMSALSLIRLKA